MYSLHDTVAAFGFIYLLKLKQVRSYRNKKNFDFDLDDHAL